ncbi:MAG: spermidine synthase [Thermoanaerobaculia bacterium]
MPTRRSAKIDLFLATFGVLALELALIRWSSHQIRVFAYFNNLVLISAFGGLGLGIIMGPRTRGLFRLLFPSLLVLAALLTFSTELGLMYLSFPDPTVALWGADGLKADETFFGNVVLLLGLLMAMATTFFFAGTKVGALFATLPTLTAYHWDLSGSLAGVLAVVLLSALHAPPAASFAVALLALAWLEPRIWTFGAAIAITALVWWSGAGASFSPYNRIDLAKVSEAPPTWILAANRDSHQNFLDLSHEARNQPDLDPHAATRIRTVAESYDAPYLITENRRRALIGGAGTGNDVAAALRNGFAHVTAVEIDPVIAEIGRELHPERPYSDPRVRLVITDARNWIERNRGEKYDVVAFGLLDSHAMFSSLSTLRLDNYVYTVEALRSSWGFVAEGGVLALTFCTFRSEFIGDRIIRNLQLATGTTPIEVPFGADSRMFIVPRNVPAERLARLDPVPPSPLAGVIQPSTDDFPFLYLRPGVVPWGYIVILSAIIVLASVSARIAIGPELFRPTPIDAALFLFGAAFLLIQTKGITDLSLLFGSTWIVNAAVFAGVLVLAILANGWVARRPPKSTPMLFVVLLAAVALSLVIRPAHLLAFGFPVSGIIGAFVNGLPIFFAGFLFSRLLSRSVNPTRSLGINLVGAIFGGCLEYLSMVFGLRFISLIALVIYAVAALLVAFDARSSGVHGVEQSTQAV